MITLPIDLSIVSEASSRQHHLDFAFPDEERDFFGNRLRLRDRRTILCGGSLAEKAAETLRHRFRFAFNKRRQLVWDDNGKPVTSRQIREHLEDYIFIANGFEVDAPHPYFIRLQLEMRIAALEQDRRRWEQDE
jgi:hypothetical protein